MQTESAHFPATPIALKMAVSIGIGMLVGMEREWSNKDVGVRSFAIVALLGMLASLIGLNVAIASLIGVLLLVAAMNTRSILTDRSLEITTSAALIVNYLLGVLVGLGHIFTPVAGAIVMTMLLAWKTELSRFAGGLQPSEIRSAVLLGLIGFVIYPVLPNRYVDPWQLFNPSDAWISVIAIAGIGFVNYVLLRIYSTRGLYLGALFGGLVNSSATVAELAARAQETGMVAQTTTLCLLTTIAMFARNLLLATLFAPRSLSATLVPLLAMALVAGFWVWRDHMMEETVPGTLTLTSPISLAKVLWFGTLFIAIQISGTLLTKAFGSFGMLATGVFGGTSKQCEYDSSRSNHGHARENQCFTCRKHHCAHIFGQRCGEPANCLASHQEQSRSQEGYHRDGYRDWNGNGRGCGRPCFPVLRVAGTPMRRNSGVAKAVDVCPCIYCFTSSLVRLLRAQARSRARSGGCPLGQGTAISESGVFGSAVPARLCLAPHPAGGNLVRPLACAPAPSVGSLGPEYPSDATLSRGFSTTRDTCVSPAVVPSARSRERGWRRGRSHRCRCDGHRPGRRFQQLFARPASNPPPRGAEDPGAILQALPSRPVSEQS